MQSISILPRVVHPCPLGLEQVGISSELTAQNYVFLSPEICAESVNQATEISV